MSNQQDNEKTGLAAHELSKFAPGFLPQQLFLQITRLTVTPILEVVPLRIKNGAVEVLLVQRDKNDPIWPGMMHTPGTVIRANDTEGTTYQSAFNRIFNEEMQGIKISTPIFVENILHKGNRGMESAIVYWAEVLEDAKVGTFYQLNKLPETIVQSQVEFINTAANNFQNKKLTNKKRA